MANFLAIIQILNVLMPLLHTAIATVEAAIPQGGKGAVKLAAVKAMLEAAFNSVNHATVKFEQVWPTLEAMITVMVKTLNLAGVFSITTATKINAVTSQVTQATKIVHDVTGAIPHQIVNPTNN